MIGAKTLAALALSCAAAAIGWRAGALDGERVAHLSAGGAFAIGLFASLCAALVGVGWQPGRASRAAIGVVRGRPALALDPEPRAVRELPAGIQRALLAGAAGCIALATLTNEATARIAGLPEDLTKPSRAGYCLPAAPAAAAAEPEPEPLAPPPVDQAGCALVKRAFALGYAKSLGSCAPQAAPVIKRAAAAPEAPEVCLRRQLDEPFLHFAWRSVAEAARAAAPVESVSGRIDHLRARVDYTGDLLADIRHSVTGTPHASHHLWINLPDPRPRTWRNAFTGHIPCSSVFAHLPLWPAWTEATPASAVIEHVLGQLLFATRFGTPASCSDYAIHWDAPADACERLAADPAGFLDASGALAPIREVLDRRDRQLALRALAAELGHPPVLPPPPEARAVVSAGCLIVGAGAPGTGAPGALAATGRDVSIEGQPIAVREVRMPAVRAAGAGPLDVYAHLALLLGGQAYAGPAAGAGDRLDAEPPGDLDEPGFPLLRLEPLVHADPFLVPAARAPLEHADLVAVAPIERHLKAFVDAFRRVYLPQRGRL